MQRNTDVYFETSFPVLLCTSPIHPSISLFIHPSRCRCYELIYFNLCIITLLRILQRKFRIGNVLYRKYTTHFSNIPFLCNTPSMLLTIQESFLIIRERRISTVLCFLH